MASPLQNAVRFSQTGPVATVLTIQQTLKPTPPPSYSLIQIRASAINPSDVGNVEGRFPQATTTPRTPGRDFAGVVAEGPAHTLGKRVWGTGGSNGFDRDGSHAEWIVVPSDAVEEMPANLSFAQAAACGVGFLTASGMVDRAAIPHKKKKQPDNQKKPAGSSGAVGTAATQLLSLTGAIPLLTSRRSEPNSINITQDLGPQIVTTTTGKGVVAIIDCVGEASLFKKALEALGENGRYVFITAGRTPGFQFTLDALDFYRHNKSLIGLNTLPISFEDSSATLAKLKQGFETGALMPPQAIEEVDLADQGAVVEAYEKVKAGAKAKLVLVNGNL
ncbi:hypothetical protein MMC12_004618 [Toensbergia leucococca]|nr:hypothetical protein [Toensbergia leucococca]